MGDLTRRVPALDGLRGIAVLLVVITHFDQDNLTLGGVMGVKMFFALSGFLITTLLLDELTATGRVSLARFYTRRALRLFPALLFLVAALGAITLAGFPLVTGTMLAATLGYVSNWYLLATMGADEFLWGPLGHTWSLAIEEQFYLLWPLLLLAAAARGRRALLLLAAGGAVASLVWSLASSRSTLAFDVSAWCLLAGCALAVTMHGTSGWRPPSWVAAAALVPVAVMFVAPQTFAAGQVAHVLTPVVTCVVIYTAVQTRVSWLETGWLVWVGQRSYGLYLWHAPIAYVAHNTAGPWWLLASIGVALSFGMTLLSWHLVELPALRLKRRFAWDARSLTPAT